MAAVRRGAHLEDQRRATPVPDAGAMDPFFRNAIGLFSLTIRAALETDQAEAVKMTLDVLQLGRDELDDPVVSEQASGLNVVPWGGTFRAETVDGRRHYSADEYPVLVR